MLTSLQVLEGCQDTTALENFSLLWEEAMTAYPGTDALPILQESAIRESAALAGIPNEWLPVLLQAAEAIRKDDALAHLVWHAYWRIFLSEEPCGIISWPEPSSLGEARGVPYLLVALGFVPLMQKYHRGLGFPENVTTDTAKQVWHYCHDNYMRGNDSRLGVYQGQLNWLRNYTRYPYVRLGRLEFWLQSTKQTYRVYRHRKSGELVAFLPAGEEMLTTGYYSNGKETNDIFLTTFLEDTEGISGTPCLISGNVSRNEVSLSKRDWELVLQKGDNVLAMHIPSGGGMTPAACREALRNAKAFFSAHFPNRIPKAVICTSWIFNTQLQEILPPEANLCQFQRMVHLLPAPGKYGLWFVFLKEWPFDCKDVVCTTSLQKNILQYLEAGHDWRVGQMFLLMDEIGH